MAKIPLTIDKNYCASWNVWSGIRELLQNAKDAEDHEGRPMVVNHYPRTARLEIITKNVYVEPASLLVLGKTSKGSGHQRGKFGEGFVLGILALVRKGHEVKFRNGDRSWTVGFESPGEGHPFEGQELLTFKSREIQTRELDFVVEIDGISTEAWDAIKKMVLFLKPPWGEDTVETEDGSLLLHPDFKGKVYVRGLFVRSFDDLACGYDLNTVPLDRDRQMINEWELHYALGKLWSTACDMKPELMAPRVYEMAKESAADMRQMKYHADDKLLKAMRDRFEQEHGEDAVPVTHNFEVREVESVGGKPAMVSNELKELLEKSGLSVEASKKRLEGTVERRWLPDEVANKDSNAWAYMTLLEKVVPHMVVVTFRGEPGCRVIDENTVVGVDFRLLTNYTFDNMLRQVVTAEAQRRGVMPLDILSDYVAATLTP